MPKGNVASTVDAEITRVTPKQAREWLESNDVNRPIRNQIVQAYRRDMEHGRWEFTGEAVKISRTGRLLDGQHRLTALAEAKGVRGVSMLVVQGLPDETQAMMDQGVARRISDAIALSGGSVKNVALAASITRWQTLSPEITTNMHHSSLRGKVTTAEALSTFKANPDIVEAAERAQHYRPALPCSPTAIGYTWLHINRANPEACTEFFEGMADMEWAWPQDPRKAALRRLQAMSRDGEIKTTLETGVMVISVLTRSWNAWRKEEKVETILARSRQGAIPPMTPIP